MTTLLAWGAADNHGLTSVYIASDSRISWGSEKKWDYGRKVFASKKHPDILGYCGEVLFTSQVLSQIIDMIDNGLIYNNHDNADEKATRIFKLLKDSFDKYPLQLSLPSFTIIYCTLGKNRKFSLFEITWEKGTGWNHSEKKINNNSSKIEVYGSGKENLLNLLAHSTEKDNSRDLFYYFCLSIKNGGDPLSGGAPQLVGIYRNGVTNSFGIIVDGKRYLNGMCLEDGVNYDLIEWRNNLFEICDGNTMKRKKKSQPQPRLTRYN